MLYTSAEAAKLLRKLNEDKDNILSSESQSSTFRAAIDEDLESVRPEYDYSETQGKLFTLDDKIRRVRHAINEFNLTHEVPGFGMTIDQILVYIPQLTAMKQKLFAMQNRIAKRRVTLTPNVIDYDYANYDIDSVRADYEKISDELSRVQTALDVINSSEKFNIDV